MVHTKTLILVNGKPFRLGDADKLSPEDFRRLVELPDDHEVWRVIGEPDPEGQLPLDDEQVTQPTRVACGEEYRVVPPGTFGALQ
jgi:hypothetical protein